MECQLNKGQNRFPRVILMSPVVFSFVNAPLNTCCKMEMLTFKCPEVLKMRIAAIAIFPILFAIFMISAHGQARPPFPYRTPTPTPTPGVSPSPTPTPQPRPAACPRVQVQTQTGKTVRDGQSLNFIANIAGGDPKVQPTLLWNVNAGYIKDGQGTPKIEVDSTGAGGLPDRELVVEVWVGGYAPECVIQESTKVKIIAPATKFGEFGEIDWKDAVENLKALSTYLAASPYNLYVIVYAGKKSERGYAFNWMRKLKDELVFDGVAQRRIIAMDGGFREDPACEFWIVPIGAEPPRPSPTVRREEVEYPPSTRPVRKPTQP
jgi:hypothetical protein